MKLRDMNICQGVHGGRVVHAWWGAGMHVGKRKIRHGPGESVVFLKNLFHGYTKGREIYPRCPDGMTMQW